MEKLTKENFWNELHTKYPVEMEKFCKWIDEYKKRIDWHGLFTGNYLDKTHLKYHDLPIAMQIGIFLQFVAESDNKFGMEIPHIENQNDFLAIPELIKDFFFSESEVTMAGNKFGSGDDVPLLEEKEDDEPAGEEHF